MCIIATMTGGAQGFNPQHTRPKPREISVDDFAKKVDLDGGVSDYKIFETKSLTQGNNYGMWFKNCHTGIVNLTCTFSPTNYHRVDEKQAPNANGKVEIKMTLPVEGR